MDTYIPWSVHELGAGEYDFTGRLDVERFIEMAYDSGLRVTIRPGPACGAELPDHGYPARVLERKEVQALRPTGIPYILPTATHFIPVPSYSSTEFLREVAAWYAEVGRRLARLQAPDGPIIACQVDNEMGYHFQAHPFALDYHPEALAAFADYCGGAFDAPRDGRDEPEPRRLAWMRFREERIRYALGLLAGMLRASGFDRVTLFHNDYARTETPLDLGALEASGAVNVAGLDIYSGRRGSRWLADTIRHLTGSSRLPWIPELGSGWLALPWLLPSRSEPGDHEVVALVAAALGVRVFNFYMLADRDRWYGAPLDRHGRPAPAADAHRRLNTLLDQIRLHELERDVRVLLVENRVESQRLEALSTLGELVPGFTGVMPFDFSLTSLPDPRREIRARWMNGFRQALNAAGCDYDRASSSSLPPLDRYEVVLVPVIEALESDARRRLEEAGSRIVCGPALPTLDERLQPQAPPQGWRLLERPEDAIACLPRPAFHCSDPDVEVIHWRGSGRTVLALLHHGSDPKAIEVAGRSVQVEPWSVTFQELPA